MSASVHQKMLDAIAQLPDDEVEVARKSREDRRIEQYCLLSHAHEELRNCANALDLILLSEFFNKPIVPANVRGALNLIFASLEAMSEKLGDAL